MWGKNRKPEQITVGGKEQNERQIYWKQEKKSGGSFSKERMQRRKNQEVFYNRGKRELL